jgi:hypothetical protein
VDSGKPLGGPESPDRWFAYQTNESDSISVACSMEDDYYSIDSILSENQVLVLFLT